MLMLGLGEVCTLETRVLLVCKVGQAHLELGSSSDTLETVSCRYITYSSFPALRGRQCKLWLVVRLQFVYPCCTILFGFLTYCNVKKLGICYSKSRKGT